MVNFNPISYLLLDTIDRVLLYTKINKLTIIVKTKTVSLFCYLSHCYKFL